MNTTFKNNLTKVLLLFFYFSIFLDLHIFYNRISTLLRVLVLSTIFLIVFLKQSSNSEKKKIMTFFSIYMLYTILHVLHANNFTNIIPTNYSVLGEFLYAYKMLMSYVIVYVVIKLNIKKEDLVKYIKYILWFVSGSILLANIFQIGYMTYSFEPLKYNIFNWLRTDLTYKEVSGKGFFHLANQIIAIILLYLPILINEIKQNFKKTDILLSVVVLLSMLILGNRLSSIGPIIILALSLLIYSFLILLKKESFEKKYVLYLITLTIFYMAIFTTSPLLKRSDNYKSIKSEASNTVIKNEEKDNSEIDYTFHNSNLDESLNNVDIKEMFDNRKVNYNFPSIYYPYNEDKEFWDNLLETETTKLTDSRFLEISISKRMKQLNNNAYDNYFGIGYTRIINVVNIERDYVMQYYSIGILGVIAYLGIYLLSVIYILNGLRRKYNYEMMLYIVGVLFFFIAAYYSGNILNAISTIIPISFILGVLINEITQKKKFNNTFLGFKATDKNPEEIIKDIKEDIKNNKRNVLFNVNPIIVMNFYKDPKALHNFNKESYLIPDGIGIVLASKLKKGSINKRIPGVEMFGELFKLGVEENLKILLYGAQEEVITKTRENLLKDYPKLKTKNLFVINGYKKEKDVLKEIDKIKPDMMFVGLGSPIQEKFIMNNDKKFSNIKVIMPVGGTFDVVSGYKKRAPKLFVKLYLEWFYRLLKEPKRIKEVYKLFWFLILVLFDNKCYNIGDEND